MTALVNKVNKEIDNHNLDQAERDEKKETKASDGEQRSKGSSPGWTDLRGRRGAE